MSKNLNNICCLAVGLFILSIPQNFQNKRHIYAKGWDLPDPACLTLEKIEKANYPEIPFDITLELRQQRGQSEPDRICYTKNPLFLVGESFCPNIFVKEEACALTTFRRGDGGILCYRYVRLLKGLVLGSQKEASKLKESSMIRNGVQISYIFDLDDDGVNESMIHSPYEEAEERILLISIFKWKMGIARFVEKSDLL